jgi:carboxymethylenebutenolidase
VSDVIMIRPARAELADRVTGLEIKLGGTQRGFIALLADADTAEIEIIEVMNNLAVEGFESLAVQWQPGVEALAVERGRAAGFEDEQIGVVGIGAGATAAFGLARSRSVGAVVSVSPSPDLTAVADRPTLMTPWLGLVGSESGDLDRAEVAELRRLLDASSDVYGQIVVYDAVGRDFHRQTSSGTSFAASYDAWQRTVEWLLARVAPRLTPLALGWRERVPVS